MCEDGQQDGICSPCRARRPRRAVWQIYDPPTEKRTRPKSRNLLPRGTTATQERLTAHIIGIPRLTARRAPTQGRPYRVCANSEKDAQCAPLQGVQRRRGSHCRIPRLTARRVVGGKRRSAAGGRCSEAFSRKRHDFRRGCAGNRNAATRIADPYIPRLRRGGTPGTAFPTGNRSLCSGQSGASAPTGKYANRSEGAIRTPYHKRPRWLYNILRDVPYFSTGLSKIRKSAKKN